PTAKNFATVHTNIPMFSFNPLKLFQYSKLIRSLNPDLVHFTLSPQYAPLLRRPYVTFTHDLTMFKFVRAGKLPLPLHWARMFAYRYLMWRVHKKAVWVHTPTQYVADAVNKKYLFTNRKTSVTLEASEPPLPVKATVPEEDPGEFILYTGSAFPHKNLERLILAFGILRESHPDLKLVLVGKKEWHKKKLEQWATKSGNAEGVIFTVFIPDEELKWYYENAKAYIFPSMSDGFGVPALEAQVHSCPVVSSDATCLPEVAGDGAHYFDPYDVADMAHKINDVITDTRLRNKLIAAGYENVKRFSWSKMAKETLSIYDKILK
ncbi:MAG: glycosyltransferase family 4 protein, partial [Anaerorhabdus sp.]|uniref:glycosyltransferase family 4 protein n=1 Tax=Anaerorhabdus sp. TaxID=1872524 RepID=UPI003A861DBC